MFYQTFIVFSTLFFSGLSARFLPNVLSSNLNVRLGSDQKYTFSNPSYNSDSDYEYGFDINEMLNLVNQARQEAGARPLRINKELMDAAQTHCADQANSGKISHEGSSGSNFISRSKATGYFIQVGGENVAYNQKTVADVMDTWMNSPGHYRNIVNPGFTDFGAGMQNYYWTQNFGTQY